VPVTGVEYKLRLPPDMVSNDGRKALWALIGAQSSEVTQKKCRLVQFLDVSGDYIHGVDFIVRHRAKLDKDACPSAAPESTPKGDLTLKFRTADGERAARERDAQWMKGAGEHKFEQDVGMASGGGARLLTERIYSASTKVDDASVPENLRALRAVFSGALAPLGDEAALGAGCRRIFEENWELKSKKDSGLPEEIALTAWYAIAKNGKKVAEPIVAELSFKADPKKPDTMARADALMGRLARTIDPTWVAPGGSKTEAAAACQGD
jgi:hypothetical protein